MNPPKKHLGKVFVLLVLVAMLCTTVLASAQTLLPPTVQVVRQQALLLDAKGLPFGTAEYWNTRNHFHVKLALPEGWLLRDAQVYADTVAPPLTLGKPVPWRWPCQRVFTEQDQNVAIQCSLVDELSFRWGLPRTRQISVHADVVKLNSLGYVIAKASLWALPVDETGAFKPYTPFPGLQWGGYFNTTWYHPSRGHFIDSPVAGLTYETPTQSGVTDVSGGFDYFPGERVHLFAGSVYLGSPLADQKTTPLDVFESNDLEDNAVINMARLLQSLDADGEPKGGINITAGVVSCLEAAVDDLALEGINFYDDVLIEDLLNQTMARCAETPDVTLVKVSAEDAKANLAKSLDTAMFRKNVSKTPAQTSTKSKLDLMARWFPALKANGEPVTIEYHDEDGNLIRTATEAKPVVVTYTDGVEPYGKEDVFAGVSRDDGNTFKRVNLSRAADKSSFTLANGEPYYGEAKKPVVQVKGNYIFIAWTSKYCNGGRPTYAIKTEDTPDDPDTPENEFEANYPYDDPYYQEDIWGVAGPQRSVDYTELDFPEVGEVPYSCVWTARGVIATQKDADAGFGDFVGDIVWFKPERLTSGRRDANQVFAGGADGAGFGIVWQEDPEGLRPGQALGPGPGWGGATTNHKTDIWYSYITWADFQQVDYNFVPGGDPVHEDPDIIGRYKALVPMSLPVRITDNDVVNTDNLMVQLGEDGLPVEDENGNWIPLPNPDAESDEGDGTHAYGYKVPGLCVDFHEKINEQGETKKVCVTADGRLLDGDTGAARPNLNLQTYTHNNGTPTNTADDFKSAWAIIAYDESKGVGGGAPDHEEDGGPYGDEYVADEGKNSYYHTFDFRLPSFNDFGGQLVSAGDTVNLPQKEYTVDPDTGAVTITSNISYIKDEIGNFILDWQGKRQIAYENARRPRFIMQGKSGMGPSRTVFVILYKEGDEGQGRPSDIMLRRVVVPSTDKSMDNPYRFSNFVCTAWEMADLDGDGTGETNVCVGGAQNISTVTPTYTTPSMGDPEQEDPYGAIKVVEWEQTPEILLNPSGVNPYEDARAHRGDINGDFLAIAYSYTPNWAAYRNGNDKYDLYVRRSFDGGQTWTTMPATFTHGGETFNGTGVTHCDTFTDPTQDDPDGNGHLQYEVCWTFGPGEFERARNLSQLSNAKSSVIEPRLVAPPGTIKNPDGTATGYPEDINDPSIFYVSYGTATNPDKHIPADDDDEEETEAVPMDLYYSFTTDLGESYVEVAWEVNPDSDGNYAGETVYRWDFLAKGDPEQGEAQLRMTPDGSRFYATWLEDAEDGSDIWFRRVMSPVFPANVAPAP